MATRQLPHAFTLIELLVVISIISLLMAVLMPALGKARAAARTTICGSGERQIFLALQAYSSDHKLRMPGVYQLFASSHSFASVPYVPQHVWYGHLVSDVTYTANGPAQGVTGYLGSARQQYKGKAGVPDVYGSASVLYCPEATFVSSRAFYYNPVVASNYGLNYHVWRTFNNEDAFSVNGNRVTQGVPLNTDLLRSPGRTILGGEVMQQNTGTTSDTDKHYFAHYTSGGANQPHGDFRHAGALNVMFFDGHIKSMREEDIPSKQNDPMWSGKW